MSSDEWWDCIEQRLRVIVVATLVLTGGGKLSAQYDRPVLPRNRVHIKHQVDSAAGISAYRLQAFRLAGSRLGSADVRLDLLRIDKLNGITSYQVTVTVADSTYFGVQPGSSLSLMFDSTEIHLVMAGRNIVYPNRDGSPRPPPLPGERFGHLIAEESAWFNAQATDLIALAQASRIEVRLTGRKGELIRFIEGSGLDQFRGFVVYQVEGAPQPVSNNPG